MRFRLTAAAAGDVIAIYQGGAARFGVAQADAYHTRLERAFEMLAANPAMAPERRELVPPMRVYSCGAHIVVYRADDDGILILRVRHQRENWFDRPA